jgi:hypothetical protein
MKKIILGAMAMVFTFGMTSCQKSWTCRCTFNGDVVSSYETDKMTRSDAKEQCNTKSTTVLGQTWDCDLY